MPLQSADYFWVGGSGNWSDTNHWATASGGSALHTLPPTKRDNVFFDANSFTGAGQIVTIAIDDAVCGDMNWSGATGSPQLDGNAGSTLRLYGSLTLITEMQFNFPGDLRFESDALSPFIRTITSAGQVFPAGITFEGNEGQWALAGPLEVRRNITLERGTFTTDSYPITCESFISDNSFSRRLDLRRSIVRLRRTDGDSVRWRVQANNFTLGANNATIQFLDPGRMDNLGNGFLEYRTLEFQADGIVDCANLVSCRVDSMRLQRNASLLNDMTILTLELSRGFEYRFASNSTFIIRTLLAEGGCEGYISLRATIDGEEALIQSAFGFMNNYVILRDIHNAGTTEFIADNSIDLGNNDGWQINEPAPRTLYWVNDGGEWYNSGHWSLSSGGPGGECPPSPLDDVFFDANSYSIPAQVTMGAEGPNYYCHDMTWIDVTGTPTLAVANLQLFGSLTFFDNMDVDLPLFHLRGDESGKTLASRGHALETVKVEGGSDWTIQDALTASLLEHFHGTFHTNGFDLTLGRYSALQAEPPKTLTLGNSTVSLSSSGLDTATWNVNNANLTLDAGTSTIRLLNPEARFLTDVAGNTIAYYEVLFEAADGSAILHSTGDAVSFQRVLFAGDATILGNNEFGTLLFSGGHDYALESGATQTIRDRWEMAGNPCNVISLSATQAGMQALVRSNNAAIIASYVNMSDQRAEGSAGFDAGLGSQDLSNNSGWTFPNGGGSSDGFLGDDRVLCTPSLTLDPGISDQGQSYLWSTGATSPALDVDQPGNYFVEISFPGDCRIRDTVDVLNQDVLLADFAGDTTLCAGEGLRLDATATAPNVTYQWQDGSSQATFTVRSSGRYEVTVTSSGCSQTSAIQVEVINAPDVDLGPGLEPCEGETVALDATVTGADAYLWNTGAATPGIQVNLSGVFWVQANIGRCARRDTVEVNFKPVPVVDLGPDQELCEGETLTLDATNAGAAYDWNTGATSPSIQVTQSGAYSVVADLNGCTATDQMQATFKPLPQIELGDDLEACEGETLTLDGASANGADNYLWSNGATTPSIQVAQPGAFTLEASLDGCTATDAVQVTFAPVPAVDLGPDQELCEGETLTLDATNAGAAYDWNTGATTPSIQVTQSGAYGVVVDLNGCTAADQMQATFKPLPLIDLGADRQPCEGETVTLVGTSANGADAYQWSNGATTPTIQVAQSGTYTLEAILNGCIQTEEIAVSYISFPDDLLGEDRQSCEGETVTLDATVPYGDAVYQWNTGPATGLLSVTQSGYYQVGIDVGGCTRTDEVKVVFSPVPFFGLGEDASLCEGEIYDLFIPVEGDAYQWSDGSIKEELRVTFPGGLVWGEVIKDGCSYRDTVQVDFQPAPQVDLGMDTTICAERPLTLRSGTTAGTILWSTGAATSSIQVASAGTYWVKVRDGVCTVEDSIRIDIRDCVFFDAYVPNAFSPNNDGVNDQFQAFLPAGLQISHFRFAVFDRWGNQVFETTNPDDGWDGTHRGQELPQGVYVYFLDLRFVDDDGPDERIESGDVVLLR